MHGRSHDNDRGAGRGLRQARRRLRARKACAEGRVSEGEAIPRDRGIERAPPGAPEKPDDKETDNAENHACRRGMRHGCNDDDRRGWQLAPTEPKAAIQTTGAAEASLAPISVFEMMGRHGKSLPAQAWDAF